MRDMFCTYSGNREEAIVAYLYDGEMDAAERSAFESHLAECAVCRDEVAGLRGARAGLPQWTPPLRLAPSALAEGEPLAGSPAGGRHAARASGWGAIPVWAQVLAATLVLGVAAGAANLSIHHDASGFTVRTGWMAPPAPLSPAAGADAPWRADLAKLESDLRAERGAPGVAPANAVAPAPASDASEAALLRQVKTLIAESEKREQSELALRIAQLVRDGEAERTADLVKVERMLGLMQNSATIEVARNRQMINSLAMQVSQTVR